MDLKKLRRMADLTQFQLAQRCGVSRMRLSLAECGQLQLRPDEDRAVRNVLLRVIESRAAQLKGVLSGREAVPKELAASEIA
jgi:transcriptional regulator with XRE-family HTH domain